MKLLAFLFFLTISVPVFAYDVEECFFYYNTYEELSITEIAQNNGLKDLSGQFRFYGKESVHLRVVSDVFNADSGLYQMTFSAAIESIGVDAFFNKYFSCVNLFSEIIIPKSVRRMEGGSFRDNCYMQSISVHEDNPYYNSYDSCNAVIETATGALVLGCKKTIIPYGVTKLEHNAFDGCDLEEISIPESVTSMGGDCIIKCPIREIVVPASLRELDNNPFRGNWSLEKIEVKEGNPVYDSRYGCNALIETAKNKLISGCTKTIIPEDVTELGDMCMHNFHGSSLEIPQSVTVLANNIAYETDEFKDLIVHWNSPAMLQYVYYSDSPFSFLERTSPKSMTLHVPFGTKANYESYEYWKDFGTIVEEQTNAIKNVKGDDGQSSYPLRYDLQGRLKKT